MSPPAASPPPLKARSVAASKRTSIDPSESAIVARTSRGAGARRTRTTCGDVTVPPGNVAVTEYVPGTRGIKPERKEASTRRVTTSSPTHASKPFSGSTVAVTVVFKATPGSVTALPLASLASMTRPNVSVQLACVAEDDPDGLIFEFIPTALPATTFNDVRDPTRAPPGEWNTSTSYLPTAAVEPGGNATTNRPSSSIAAPVGDNDDDVKVEPPPCGVTVALNATSRAAYALLHLSLAAILTTSVSPTA